MYVKENHRITNQKLDEVLDSLEVDGDVPLDVIIMIHYVYHQMDDNYDGGLSLLDSLHHKLALYFDSAATWDLDGIKSIIRESNKPQEEFYGILHQMLTPEMIAIYGV